MFADDANFRGELFEQSEFISSQTSTNDSSNITFQRDPPSNHVADFSLIYFCLYLSLNVCDSERNRCFKMTTITVRSIFKFVITAAQSKVPVYKSLCLNVRCFKLLSNICEPSIQPHTDHETLYQ